MSITRPISGLVRTRRTTDGCSTAKEYEKRYGRVHATYDKLGGYLWFAPHNINRFGRLTKFAQAMPEYCKREDPVEAYRYYYINEKKDFAKWTNRAMPWWYQQAVGGF
jgi:hypothetical protein